MAADDRSRPTGQQGDSQEQHQVQDISPADILPGRELIEAHRELLTAHAIDLAKVNGQIRSAIEPADLPAYADPWWRQKLPAMLFRYGHNGLTEWQLRPDDPGDGAKYLFREGSTPPVNCVRDDGGHGPVLLVEGSKQALAAASYTGEELAIYGMFGCWGWSERDLTFAAKRLVYVILDADLATNRKVWEAAKALRDHLAKTVKAAGVRFVIVPGAGSTGLDDYLATIVEGERAQALANLLDGADPELPKAPAAKKEQRNQRYFNGDRIKPVTVAKALHAKLPMALTAENRVAVYRRGVYRTNSMALVMALVQLLGDDYGHGHLATVEDAMLGTLEAAGHRLPDHIDRPWMNGPPEVQRHRRPPLPAQRLPGLRPLRPQAGRPPPPGPAPPVRVRVGPELRRLRQDRAPG